MPNSDKSITALQFLGSCYYFHPHKKNQNRCCQAHFWGSKYVNAFAATTLPRTLLGSYSTPDTPSWIWRPQWEQGRKRNLSHRRETIHTCVLTASA